MELKIWLELERGRGTALAKSIGVPQSFVSLMASGGKQVPFEQCVPIEQYTRGEVTRADLRPDDYLKHWPELGQAQTTPAPAATEFIAVVKAAIDEIVHQADDRMAELKKDAQVEIKHTSVEVRGEIEKEAHDAMERLGAPKPWDGSNRRATVADVAAQWDGRERRERTDRRAPEVLESPAPIFTAEAVAMARLKTTTGKV